MPVCRFADHRDGPTRHAHSTGHEEVPERAGHPARDPRHAERSCAVQPAGDGARRAAGSGGADTHRLEGRAVNTK